RFKRYGYAIVSFGEPIDVDAFIRSHPQILSNDFEQRKGDLRALAESVMDEISAALPITPVTLAARIFAESPHPVTDHEMIERMDAYRERWRDRIWLLREKN